MSLSDRLSDRVTNDPVLPLVSAPGEAVKGADEVEKQTYRGLSAPRLGRRGLGSLKQELSERDVLVVRSVADLRFVSAPQLERLHFSGSGVSVRSSRRVLARLSQLRLLRRLDRRIGGLRAGSASFIYTLGPVGERLLRTEGVKRHHEPSAALLQHCMATAELFVSVVTATRGADIDLVDYETEPGPWRRVAGLTGTVEVRPDLSVVLARGDIEWHWFIEVDLGTEHRSAIRRKCRQYQAYFESGVEQQRRGVFPRVAWLTGSQERAAELEQAIAGDSRVHSALFAVGTLDNALPLLAPEVRP